MHFVDLTLPTIEENLALDEALLLDAEAGGPEVLRTWEWPRLAVVLGAGGKWREETCAVACQADCVPILRRASGGGAVLLGPGCLLFSLVLAYDRDPVLNDLHASYRLILTRIAGALGDLAPGLAPAGISDLAVGGQKCSGNSQQRKRSHLLHHGTLLNRFDVDSISRYLAHPPREPDYRRQRGHREFVMNLDVSSEELKRRLRAAWQAEVEMTVWPTDLMRGLVSDKYASEKWQRRR